MNPEPKTLNPKPSTLNPKPFSNKQYRIELKNKQSTRTQAGGAHVKPAVFYRGASLIRNNNSPKITIGR
jgi:hypothetical protein